MDFTSTGPIPSWVSQSSSAGAIHQNPLTDLASFIDSQNLSADLLLCPGDIADKADDSALLYAWGELQTVGSLLHVKSILGAVGNHDLHSRSTNGKTATPRRKSAALIPPRPASSPDATIKRLDPSFPISDADEFRRFWADQVALYTDDSCRVITLNSCASHGYISEETPEYLRGRFSELAETRLSDLISNSQSPAINILLTHHHPQQITDLEFTDQSAMLRGDRLLRMLGSGEFGSWIVVHGHRHIPFFCLGPGDNDRPYIFSAGSLGVILHPGFYPTRPPNQFYIIEFDLGEIQRHGGGLFGFISAWNWNHGTGWQVAGDSDPIPAHSGFGNTTQVSILARQVAEYIKDKAIGRSSPAGFFEEEITTAYPQISFLLPSERKRFRDHLEQEGIHVGTHPRERNKLLFVYVDNANPQGGSIA